MLIGMPVYDDVEMIDVTAPTTCSRWAGLDVELVTEKPGLVRFRNGFCFEVTKSLKQARRWDAIWVPGGDVTALKRLMGDKVFLEFLKRQSARAKYVASVCEGTMLLAAAKLLDGYTATTHRAFIPCSPLRFIPLDAGHRRTPPPLPSPAAQGHRHRGGERWHRQRPAGWESPSHGQGPRE